MPLPEPPHVSLFSRYVFENPWPAGLALLVIALWLGYSGMREGLMNKVRIAAVFAVVGAAIILTGFLIVTSGERAKAVARSLVDAAVAGDRILAVSLFAPQAVFTVGSPKNPGMGRDFIQNQIIRLIDRYTIESSTITMLRGYSESSDSAEVHLACFTEVNGFPYPNVSRWVLHVQRQPDGQWMITQLTCVAINDRTPPLEGLR